MTEWIAGMLTCVKDAHASINPSLDHMLQSSLKSQHACLWLITCCWLG